MEVELVRGKCSLVKGGRTGGETVTQLPLAHTSKQCRADAPSLPPHQSRSLSGGRTQAIELRTPYFTPPSCLHPIVLCALYSYRAICNPVYLQARRHSIATTLLVLLGLSDLNQEELGTRTSLLASHFKSLAPPFHPHWHPTDTTHA